LVANYAAAAAAQMMYPMRDNNGKGAKPKQEPAAAPQRTMWQQAADAAVSFASHRDHVAAAAGPTVSIPDGFKALEDVSDTVLPPSRRPQQTAARQWYYNDKRQLFWNNNIKQLHVWDPILKTPAEFREAVTSDFRMSLGACFHADALQSRHVLIKDLTKVAPSVMGGKSFDHLDKPCSLFALYEGHRGDQGNLCADFCATNLHMKLLHRLAGFTGYWDNERLEDTFIEIFHELDAEFEQQSPNSTDGCCAIVVLLLGQRLVLVSLGDVACVVCKRSGEMLVPFKPHAVRLPDDDDDDDDDEDDDNIQGQPDTSGPAPAIRYTRSFGDLDFKQATSSPQLSVTPDFSVTVLNAEHRGVALVCRALYNAIGRENAVSTVFRRSRGRPRMASGAMVDAAVQWLGQGKVEAGLGSIVAFFDNMEEPKEVAPLKKRKTETPSQVRLRHILLKHNECKSTKDIVRKKDVKRSRGEAERMLRAILEECEVDPKKCIPAFTERCQELSECQSASMAGDLSGDLGWVKSRDSEKHEQKFGPSFHDAAFSLQVGQLSDLIDSDQGIHILLRTA
jgi:NIMA-interacting peptidyl-prolyl cis-trans isomerase 1